MCLPYQVLAVFSTIPPIVEVAQLAPDLWRWSTNLPWVPLIKQTWIKFVTQCPTLEVLESKEMVTEEAFAV